MTKFNNNLVVQSNKLIEARFTEHMTEHEQKTIAFVISETKPEDINLFINNQNKVIELPAKHFADVLKTDVRRIYNDAESLSKSLTGKKFRLKFIGSDGKPAFKEITFINTMSYEAGHLTIKINSDILMFLVELKENFTAFRLENVLRLGSGYAIKVYQLLKQYEQLGFRELTIEELKDTLAIDDNKSYKLYSDFKRRVLEISKKHINQHTDIQIDYEEIKQGRKVHKIKFYIKPKLTQEKQAKLAFESWILSSTIDKKYIAIKDIFESIQKTKKDPFASIPIKDFFSSWLEKKISNYEPNSCDPLQYFAEDTLFYNDEV